MGPTGSGKTDAAIFCAQHLPVDLISVDSALVYRGLDIGTAKPDPDTLAAFPHRLVDVVEVTEKYSAGRFRADALAHMHEIRDAGRLPVLVGGTMLYFRALEQGLAKLPGADPVIRANLDRRARQEGWPALHQELKERDPLSAARIHPNDAQRIQRALEIVLVSGKTRTQWHEDQAVTTLEYELIKVCLAPSNRESLYTSLEVRFKEMIKNGFLEEVAGLYKRNDLHPDLPAMRSVGYRQLWRVFTGEDIVDTACAKAVTATRRLAKRQLTWLRTEKNLAWIDSQDPRAKEFVLENITTQLKALGHPCDTLPP